MLFSHRRRVAVHAASVSGQPIRCFALFAALFAASPGLYAANITWTTGGASDGLWATSASWLGGAAPTTGDSVFFGATTGTTTLTYDIANTAPAWGGITFNSGASAYTISGGTMTMAGGTAAITNSSTNAQVINSVFASGFTVAGSGGLTLGGQIVAGNITKNGTGTLTLAGNNTYTGSTAVNAGTLAYGAAASSANSDLTVGSSGAGNTTALTITNTGGTRTVSKSLTFNGAVSGNTVHNLSVTNSGSTASVLTFGPLTVQAGIASFNTGSNALANQKWNFDSLTINNGGMTMFQRGGVVTLGGNTNNGTLNVIFASAPSLIGTGSAGTTSVGIVVGVMAGSYINFVTYDANGLRNLNTSTEQATLASGMTSGQNARAAASGTTTLSVDTTVNSLQILAGSPTIALGGKTLTVTSGMLAGAMNNGGPGTQTIGSAVGDGTLQFGGANAYIVSDAKNTIVINSTIAGTGGLTLAGANSGANGAATVLAGANTISGTARMIGMYSTTVKLTNSLALQNLTLDYTNYGASFTFGNGGTTGLTDYTFGGLQGSQNIALTNNNTTPAAVALTVGGNGNSTTYSGVLSGAGGSLIKAGAGTLTLSGSNTYTGSTTVNAGVLALSGVGRLGATTAGLTLGGGSLDLGGLSGSVGTVSITTAAASGNTIQNGTLTGTAFSISNSTGTATVSAVLAGSGASLTKGGAGTLVLGAAATYSGATSVTAGRLQINSAGAINSTSGITINGATAELNYNSATALTKPITFMVGTLSGTGAIGTAVTVGSSDILSPGNSPGSQAFTQGLTFDQGGQYTWEINNWTGAASTGYDQLVVSGSALNITATSGSSFTIAIAGLTAGNVAGVVPSFSAGTTGTTFTIATSAAGITGFDKTKFTIDTSAFTNNNPLPTNAGFWLSQSGSTSLILNYAPSATYTLAANATAAAIRVGGTSTITATVTSSTASVINPDSVAYTGLALSGGLGSLSSTSGTLSGGQTGSGSVLFTGTAAGAFTFNPSVSGNNVNIGKPANAGSNTGVTVSAYDYANAKYTGGVLDFGVVHQGASVSSQTVAIGNQTVTNASYQDFLNVSGSSTNAAFTVTGFSNLAASASGTSTQNLSVGLSTATAGSLAGTINVSLVSNANGVSGLSNGAATVIGTPGSITTAGGVFSGNGIWSGTGGGSWGTGASSNWTSAEGVAAAPGTFGGYTNTDTATFAGAVIGGTATIDLTGVIPSLKSITFNTGSASYLLSGGAIAMSSNSGTAGLNVLAGTHEIASNLTFTSLTAVDIATSSLLTLSGTISGSGGFVKTGGGELDLKAANSFSGNTDINAGILKIFNASTFGSGTVTLASGATLNLNNLSITNTLINNGGTILNSGSYTGTQTVSGSAHYTGSTAGTIAVSNGGSATFSGPVSANVTLADGASASVSGAVASTGTFAVNANGALTATQGSSFAAGSRISNAGQFNVSVSSGTTAIASTISGTGSFAVSGGGLVRLTGSSSGFSGQTTVSGNGTTLSVNGFISSNKVTVNAGAVLGGSGVITGTVGGDGLIGPGNSPGILTVSQVDPTSLTSFAFEFMKTGDPIWSSGTASQNDVLQLTNLTTPFVHSLQATNVVNVYFEVSSLSNGDIFRGGFFSNSSSLDFAGAIGSPTYQYFVLNSGSSGVLYNGSYYDTLSTYLANHPGSGITGVTQSIVTVPTADFSGGTINNGQVTQFVIVPEPDTMLFAGIGIAMAGWSLWKRRRIPHMPGGSRQA